MNTMIKFDNAISEEEDVQRTYFKLQVSAMNIDFILAIHIITGIILKNHT